MNDSPTYKENYKGFLSLRLLYVGSKSESEYPSLLDDQDNLFRIHVTGSKQKVDPFLIPYLNQYVQIYGKSDKLRGHTRIVIDSLNLDSIQIIEFKSCNEKTEVKFENTDPKRCGDLNKQDHGNG